jgi:hypothetical protein
MLYERLADLRSRRLGFGTAARSLEGFYWEGLDMLGPGLRRRIVKCHVASEMHIQHMGGVRTLGILL